METINVKHLLNKHRAEIKKQLEYLVNVAKRLKLTPPTWEFSDVYEHEFSILVGASGYGEDRDEEYEMYIETCFDVTLHVAETLKIDGDWIFACAIDHRAKAMIQVYEDAKIPMRYNPSNDCCEHCGKKYPRVKSFVVLNEKTNEFKQVGKGCLKQFLGINPASYITMFEAISKFSPFIEGYGRKNTGGRLDNLAYDVKDMLRYTIHQVAKDNGAFVKAEWEQKSIGEDYRGFEQFRNVRTNEGEATIDKVKIRLGAISYFRMNPNAINDTTTIEQLEERIKFYSKRLGLYEGLKFEYESRGSRRLGEIGFLIQSTKQHIHAIKYKNLVDEVVLDYNEEYETIKSFVSYLVIPVISEDTGLSSFDQYKQQLKTVFLKERTLQANLKTIVSGYGFFLKQIEREKQDAIRKENAKYLKHVGVVGEKTELILKVIDVKYGEGQYGTWKLWKLEDESGNKFSKFGELAKKFTVIESVEQPESESNDASIGSTISVTAMVKDHQVYRDEKNTVLGIFSKTKKAAYLYETKKVK
jgi:hypothetical protein